jgi:hypothetical protein
MAAERAGKGPIDRAVDSAGRLFASPRFELVLMVALLLAAPLIRLGFLQIAAWLATP